SSAGGIKYEGNIEVGGVKVGSVTATCLTSNAGMLKYDSNNRCMSYCNGSNWTNISCITYSWSTSSYGSCSASCGGGTQTRTVTCKSSDGSTVADSYCSGTKPTTSQSCNTQLCPTNGSCGSANGSSRISAPTSNLCSAGTASSVSGSGPRTWTCNGSNGGVNANCSASVRALEPIGDLEPIEDLE
ncbi:MAG: hypothetical protein LBG59_07685, partial [Candidatus Peribacteria bacterium]|nr:hypothetical protein [Candidatus Peribacteria bacterium]